VRNRANCTLRGWFTSAGVLAVLAGCSHLPWGPRALASCPGVLRPVDAIDGNFVAQQQVRIRTETWDLPLRVVVQKTGGELILIGFDPIGAKLFTLVQKGSTTRVDALPRAVWPISPMSVLRDLHRIRFLAAPRPAGGSGTTTRSFDDTTVTDTWRGGTRVARSLQSPGDRSPTRLRFDAESVSIENPGCGYTSEWTTSSEQAIP